MRREETEGPPDAGKSMRQRANQGGESVYQEGAILMIAKPNKMAQPAIAIRTPNQNIIVDAQETEDWIVARSLRC